MTYAEFLVMIRRISRSVNLESKRIERDHGISIPQLLTLHFLHQQPLFKASHKQIKDFLQLNASTVTGIIARLIRKGLVAKLPRTEDRRVSSITITQEGARLLDRMPDLDNQHVSEKLASQTPAEQAELMAAFQQIISFLNEPPPIESSDLEPDMNEFG